MTPTLIHQRLARCMALLPALCPAIAEDLGISADRMQGYLRWMHAEGLVMPGHIVRWRGRVWHAGTMERFERTAAKAMPPGIASFAIVWRELPTRHTAASLSQRLGMPLATAQSVLEAMHGQRLVRIAGWAMGDSRIAAPIFDRLPGGDAPYPHRARADINAEHWARRRERMHAAGLSTRARITQLQAGA